MLKFVALAAVGVISAAGAAQAVVMLSQSHPAAQPELRPAQTALAVQPVSPPHEDVTAGTGAELAKAADGHFWAEASVNGERVRFLVDTGATAVALTVQDAQRLGFQPASLNYTYQVMTANGPARAAQVRLASIAVAGARVDDVQALVIEKGLPTSLLGMTYLGRLSQFEATPTALILRP